MPIITRENVGGNYFSQIFRDKYLAKISARNIFQNQFLSPKQFNRIFEADIVIFLQLYSVISWNVPNT